VSEQFLNGTSAHRRPFQCHYMVLRFKNETQDGPKYLRISICFIRLCEISTESYNFLADLHLTLGLVCCNDDVIETKIYKVSKETASCRYVKELSCRKQTILSLQGSVGTHNRCCGQYMHCLVGNLFRCKSAKNYKIRLRFHKAVSI